MKKVRVTGVQILTPAMKFLNTFFSFSKLISSLKAQVSNILKNHIDIVNSLKKWFRCWHGHFWPWLTSKPLFFYSSSGDEITLLEGNFVSHLYPWTKTWIWTPAGNFFSWKFFVKKSRDPHKVIDALHRSLALTWTKIWGKALDHPIFWKNDELGTKKGFNFVTRV